MSTEMQYSPGSVADKDIEINPWIVQTIRRVVENPGNAASNLAWISPDVTSRSWGHLLAGNPVDSVHEPMMLTVLQTEIKSLPAEEYELIRPIPVRIEKTEAEEYLACFVEANIGMTGETSTDAVENLIFDVLDTFELFLQEENNLGPEPTRELSVLKRYLNRKR